MDPSLSNSTPMDPLNATDSSPCTCRLSSLGCLACLTSVRSHRLPSCSLWCWRCSFVPNAICLSHSVDSSVLSYTMRNPPLPSIVLNSFSTCTNLKYTRTFVSVCSIKIFGIWPHADRQTDIHMRLAMMSRWCEARCRSPNYTLNIYIQLYETCTKNIPIGKAL